MSTRRQFVTASSAALTATALGMRGTAAVRTDVDAPLDALPASIRELRPMTAGVTPITVAERLGRIEKAKKLMRALKMRWC